ncbi:MAG TPA: glycosyltransferase family 9 protein, partial [Ignavibacteria bacterium]|nr:glycosyltransferase family 9 protein [Ignavibacteria bacterium]
MKYADEYIGRILCALLGRSISQQAGSPATAGNILFIKFWGMGSIILTAPAVQKVRQKFPQAKLHYLTFETNREVLEVLGIADNIITIKLSNPFKFNIDTLKLIKKLRQVNFDIVYDFEFFTYYSALINRFIKPKFSTGFDNRKNKRSRLFTHTVGFNDHIHTQNNFLDLVSGSNIPSLHLGEQAQPEPETKSVLANKPYIVINPNASKMAYERRLPAAYF